MKSFAADDTRMQAAIQAARSTFRQFLDAYLHPQEGQSAFLVKVALEAGNDTEHLWVADLDFTQKPPRGVIANDPQTAGLEFKQPVEFGLSQITDWMYIDKGNLVGGYTTRLIRDLMTPEERAAYDATAPYQF
jgi:uncharacterized protein YegJ (DUF2314 family)